MSPAVRTVLTQGDWSAGMNRDVAPALIPENGAYDVADGLLDSDGTLYRRGGTVYKSKEGLGEAGLTWIWDGYLKPGRRTVFANASDFGTLAADDETVVNLGGNGLSQPKQSAVLEELLFIGGVAIYGGSRKSAAYSTGTVELTKGSAVVKGSGTSWSANVDSGMVFHVSTERVYIVASVDSDTQITLRDTYEGGSAGSGKSYSLSPIWAISGSDPYEAWDYVTTCANRLVIASGRKVLFTEIKNPHTFTNSLSTTNEHTLPEGVECIGLATVGQTVLIFTTGGIYVLDGLALDITDLNGNPQHRLQQLSSDIVLAGGAGLAGYGQSLVVPAADGIYLMDGVSQPVRISRPVERLYRKRITDGYRIGKAAVYKGHYFLPILDGSADVKDLLVCRVDRSVRSRDQSGFPWSRFTGDGAGPAYTVRVSTDPRQPELLGVQASEPSRVVDCSGYFSPEAVNKADADGSVHVFELITRDYETGSLTTNAVRALLLRYELTDALEDNPLVKVYYSDGALETGEAKWDEVTWDDFEWASDGGAAFSAISKDGPASDGRDPVRFRVNKRLRYVRFRITTSGAAASFSLRHLQLAIRPSGATRR